VLERRIGVIDICSDSSYDLFTFESYSGGSPRPGQEITCADSSNSSVGSVWFDANVALEFIPNEGVAAPSVPSSSHHDSGRALRRSSGHSCVRGSRADAALTSWNRASTQDGLRGQSPPSDKCLHRRSSSSRPHGQRSTSGTPHCQRSMSGKPCGRRFAKVKKLVFKTLTLGLPEAVQMIFICPFIEGIILPRLA
jgi:hypothetical protein